MSKPTEYEIENRKQNFLITQPIFFFRSPKITGAGFERNTLKSQKFTIPVCCRYVCIVGNANVNAI